MTLLIVDMQYGFKTHEKCLSNVVAATRRAVENNEAIVCLEYLDQSYTHDDITEILDGYENSSIAIKDDNDGAKEALSAFCKLNTDFNEIRICGVNTCWCVSATAQTLAKMLPEIKITIDAEEVACTCWDNNDGCMDILNGNIKLGREEGFKKRYANDSI